MRVKILVGALLLGLGVVACHPGPADEEAGAVFEECLERNGVEAEILELTLNEDGTIAALSLQVMEEGDTPFEPAIRLACTQAVENG